jgi:hypothetical protein
MIAKGGLHPLSRKACQLLPYSTHIHLCLIWVHPINDIKLGSSVTSKQKEMNERIADSLCRFSGEKWDRNHGQKCKVWGKLNAIFIAQDELENMEEHFDPDECNLALAIGQ